MAAGRPRTPTGVAQLRGDYKKNPGRENKGEPVPSEGLVAPPFALTKAAQLVWNRLAPDLIRQRVLTPWDVDLFAELCEAIVMVRSRRRAARSRRASTLVAGSATPLSEYRTAIHIVAQLGSRYGLTPADRAKLTIGGGGDGDPGDDVLS